MEIEENTSTQNIPVTEGMCNDTNAHSCIYVSQETDDSVASGISNNIAITKSILGTVGVVSNAIVLIAFGSNKKYRRKIPVMFMINQVCPLIFSEIFIQNNCLCCW